MTSPVYSIESKALMCFFALALFFVSSMSAYGLTVSNGNFNEFVPTNGTGGGWTSANIGPDGGWSPNGGNPEATFILSNGGIYDTGPLIEQTVGGHPDQLIILTGDYGGIGSDDTSNQLSVTIDGATVLTVDFPGVGVWSSFAYWFPDEIITEPHIAFQSEGGTAYALDNISIVNAKIDPVPIPPAWIMLLSGIAGLWLYKRRGPA